MTCRCPPTRPAKTAAYRALQSQASVSQTEAGRCLEVISNVVRRSHNGNARRGCQVGFGHTL